MSSTYYCKKCDDFSQKNGNCNECGTMKDTVMTNDQCLHFLEACNWINDHSSGSEANQPLDYVKAYYEADSYFKDYFYRGMSFESAKEMFKLAGEKYVNSVPREQAGKNLKDVIKWRLSVENKTSVEIRACLHLIHLNTDFYLANCYLHSLL